MPFQPFGQRFDIRSSSSTAEVKQAIRSRTTGWLGWNGEVYGGVVGPVVILWSNAVTQGPTLFGWISPDLNGAKIVGRAGFGQPEAVITVGLIPIVGLFFFVLPPRGLPSGREYLLGIGFILLCGLGFRARSAFSKDAKPLVRFLKRTVAGSGEVRTEAAPAIATRALTLNVNGKDRTDPVTSDVISDALNDIWPGDFVVLASAPEDYVQTARHEDGFVLERREGHPSRHFRAVRPAGATASDATTFTTEEAVAAFMAYATETSKPPWLTWQPMRLPR